MRQVFTSPRLENVEGVARLLGENGIDNKISGDRGYKQVSRREFSFVQKGKHDTGNPAVWVIKSDDYKRARELLHGAGLIEAAAKASYAPEGLQFRQAPTADPQSRLMRIKLTLLFVLGGAVAFVVLRMLLI